MVENWGENAVDVALAIRKHQTPPAPVRFDRRTIELSRVENLQLRVILNDSLIGVYDLGAPSRGQGGDHG